MRRQQRTGEFGKVCRLSVTIPAGLAAIADDIAAAENTTRSAVLAELLTAGLAVVNTERATAGLAPWTYQPPLDAVGRT